MSITLQPGQSAAAVLGTGTVVSIGGPTGASGTETFTPIGEVKSLKLSGAKAGTTMATNFSSLGIARKLSTIVDFGTLTITTNRIGNDAGQAAVNAALFARQAYDFKIQLPIEPLLGQTTAGDVITLSGIVTQGGTFSVDIDKVSEYEFAIDLNSYTLTAGS